MATPAAVLQVLVTANTTQANAALARTQAQLTSTAATAEKSSARVGRSTAAFNSGIAQIAKYGPAALAAFGAASIKMAVDFEDAMVQISTQAGASREEVEKLKKPVIDLAKVSEFGPTELAKGLFRVESAGYRGAEAMRILKNATDLADVGHADLEETTRAYVAAIRSGIKGTESFSKTAGTMNAIVGQGSMRMNDLVSAFGTGLLPRARGVGVALDEVGAALGTLTEQGMGATQSATRLGMTFSFMVRKPTAEAAEALDTLNIRHGQMAEMLQKPNGLLRVLTLLRDRLQQIPQAQRAALLGQIFGGGRSSAAIQTLIGSLDQYTTKLQGVRTESAEFNKAIEEDNKTMSSKVAATWAYLQARATEFGLQINSALNVAFDFGTQVEEASKNGGILGAALGGIANGAKLMFDPVNSAKDAVTDLGNVLGFGGDEAEDTRGAMEKLRGEIANQGKAWTDLQLTAALVFRAGMEPLRQYGQQTIQIVQSLIKHVKGAEGAMLAANLVPLPQRVASAFQMIHSIFKSNLNKIVGITKKDMLFIAMHMQQGPERGREALKVVFDKMVGNIKSAMDSGEMTVEKGVKRIMAILKRESELLGIPYKPLSWLPENVPQPPGEKLPFHQKGGILVPGRGSGDKVPIMAEPGEVVLNRNAVAALGGAKRAHTLNKKFPRFAKGGQIPTYPGSVVPGVVDDIALGATNIVGNMARKSLKHLRERGAGGDYGAAGDIVALGRQLQKQGYSVGEHPAFGGVTGGVHVPNSWHYKGRAIDISGGDLDKLYKQLRRSGLHFLELLWRVPNHFDHIHAALQQGGIVGDFARAGVDTKASKRAMFALFMAGLAESGMRDLPGGDKSSEGVLQLLASTARRTGINPHDEYGVAKGFLTRGYWGKGGAISLAKQGKTGAMIAHLVQGNDTGTGVYSAQGGAAQNLLKESGLKFMPGDVARMGPLRKNDPKTVPKPKYDPEAWAAAIPADIQANIDRLAGDNGLINRYADYASRAASLDEKVNGKDELGWLKMQLQAQQELRDTYIAARSWIEWMVEQYSKWMREAKERIGALRYVIQEARLILAGKLKYFSKPYADMFNLPHGNLTEAQKKKIPGWIERWRAKIAEHREKIGMWTDKRTKTEALLSGEGGIGDSMRTLQGFITDPTLEWASVQLSDPKYLTMFGGEIGSVLQAIHEAGKVEPTEATENPLLAQQIALQQQMLDKLAQQLFVSETQSAVLAQTPYVGSFAQGGVVPRTGMAMVHKGEVIGSPQPIVIVVKDGAVRPDYIQAISGREAERLLRRSGRGGRVPGRPGSMT